MIAAAEQVLIKRVRPQTANDSKRSVAAAYSERLALCIIFASLLYAAIGLFPGVAGSPHRPFLLDHTFSRKTFTMRANYPTAAAWVSFRLHYYYAAVSYLSDVIRQHPRDPRAYDRRALAYWEIGQRSLADSDFRQALMIDPMDTTALRDLAWLIGSASEVSTRDARRAIKLALKACKLTGWRDADLIQTLAAAYAASGDFAKAVRTQRQVLALVGEPDTVSARLDLYIEHKPYRANVIPASW